MKRRPAVRQLSAPTIAVQNIAKQSSRARHLILMNIHIRYWIRKPFRQGEPAFEIRSDFPFREANSTVLICFPKRIRRRSTYVGVPSRLPHRKRANILRVVSPISCALSWLKRYEKISRPQPEKSPDSTGFAQICFKKPPFERSGVSFRGRSAVTISRPVPAG
jgi:hypothetical protein